MYRVQHENLHQHPPQAHRLRQRQPGTGQEEIIPEIDQNPARVRGHSRACGGRSNDRISRRHLGRLVMRSGRINDPGCRVLDKKHEFEKNQAFLIVSQRTPGWLTTLVEVNQNDSPRSPESAGVVPFRLPHARRDHHTQDWIFSPPSTSLTKTGARLARLRPQSLEMKGPIYQSRKGGIYLSAVDVGLIISLNWACLLDERQGILPLLSLQIPVDNGS